MDWEPGLELGDGLVLLRPYRRSDVDELYEAARESIDEVYPWLPWCHPGYQRSESEEWIGQQRDLWTQDRAYEFAVVDPARGGFLGGCGVNSVSRLHRFANLGYWIRSSALGRGVATAAARLVARFSFDRLDLQRLELVIEPENAASIRVAEKLGARREGLLRSRLNVENDQRDALMFSLVAGDGLVD
jgi:RimJ/RimL family protein N-acetyltransferase